MNKSTSAKQGEMGSAASGETARLDKLLAAISSKTIIPSPDEVDEAMDNLLQRLLTALSLDRVFFSLYSGASETLRLTAIKTSHAAAGVPTGFVSKPLPWYSNRLLQGKITRFSKIEELPPEARDDREVFAGFDVQSSLSIPVLFRGVVIGAFSLGTVASRRDWPDHLTTRLRRLVDLFAGAAAQKHARMVSEERLTFEKLISGLSAEFLHPPFDDMGEKIKRALGGLSGFLNFEICVLFEIPPGGEALQAVAAYSGEGCESYIEDLADRIPPGHIEKLLAGEMVLTEQSADSPHDTPSEGKTPRDGVPFSSLTIPFRTRGEKTSVVFFGSFLARRIWQDELILRLKLTGETLIRAVQHNRATRALESAESAYRTVADFTYNWEYWADMDGALRYVSPSCERISGYTPRQFMENPALLGKIIDPRDWDAWRDHCIGVRDEPKRREIQFRIRTMSGKTRWIEHACRPVLGKGGELQGVRASNSDITRRKTAELNLRRAYSEIERLKERVEADRTYLREEIKVSHDYENIVGDSDVLKYVLFRVEQIAPSDTMALILGETGTGKELIARAIHNRSPLRERPLIKVNCASLSATLIESELFGHEKGAFTGAAETRMGRFELANDATLFLDEIGELPLELQPKLLRVLQDGEFERLGSSRTIRTNARIIAATNRDLAREAARGRFRKDLWYRLNAFPLTLPPLKKRPEDIPLLVQWLVKKFEKKHGKRIHVIPTSSMESLQSYAWPGNIRELENVIERAVINTPGDTLRLAESLHVPALDNPDSADGPLKSLAEMERAQIIRALNQTGWQVSGKE
ncbi:MAG: PAS domain S-box protein, partial [Desulfobacterales bacterium]|nr:PAS domain S-box protein [Desulfobacterales bacterium]